MRSQQLTRIGTLVVALGLTTSIVTADKMYWTDPDSDKIQRANLDGSHVERLVTGELGGAFGIALDVPPMVIPALSEWGVVITAFLLLTAGSWIIVRRRQARPRDGVPTTQRSAAGWTSPDELLHNPTIPPASRW